jgi:hypothetical protein
MTHDPHEQKLKLEFDRRKAEYKANPTWRNSDRLKIAESLLRSYRRRVIPEKYCMQVNNEQS